MLELDADETVRHDPGKAKALDNVFEDLGIRGGSVILGGFIFWDLFFGGYFYYSGPIPNLLPPTW